MYTTIRPKLLGSSFIYLFHLYTTIRPKSVSFLLFNLFTYNGVNILYATFMAVLICFVHYIYGSTDLIFRTLYPWLYEVFARWSCFLRIFVGTTAIIYSELFSLALPKFVMLMRSLDDAIWNMRSFLKALCKLFLDFRFFINSIENSSVCAFSCFESRALYKKWLTNLCRTFAWMHCFLFYFCHLAVDGCSSK